MSRRTWGSEPQSMFRMLGATNRRRNSWIRSAVRRLVVVVVVPAPRAWLSSTLLHQRGEESAQHLEHGGV